MAESIRANISNADTAKAAYSSVITLLRSLETVEYRREALENLYDH
jgi:hypothetical protein